MSKKAIFQRLISDFVSGDLPKLFPRKLDLPLDVPKIVSVLGPRRAGKTYLLLYLVKQLRAEVPADRLVYLNFEDDRLYPLELKDMDDMLEGYYELYPENRKGRVWFFLDEIQEVPNWEKFVRRLLDTEQSRIYLTGSSSRMLSRELASGLRGRTLPYEVLPLSFKEFLAFNEISVDPRTSAGQSLIRHWLLRYLRQGGFPELIFLPEHLHRRTINEYIDLLLYRDITERFSVGNTVLLKYLMKFFLSNPARPISITKLYHDLRSQGYSIGKNTVFDYLSHFQEAFALFRVDIWSRSVRVQAVNPSKYYILDPAFKNAVSIAEDQGRLFENAVFLELRRRGQQPSYLLSGQEVDFYWDNGQLINACLNIHDPATRKRELNGLFKAMEELDQPEGFLLTADEERSVKQDGRIVHIRPLWKFLLE